MLESIADQLKQNTIHRKERIHHSASGDKIPWDEVYDSKILGNFDNVCKFLAARASLVLSTKYMAGNVITGRKLVDFYSANIYPSLGREQIVLRINSELVFPKDYPQVLYSAKDDHSPFKDGKSLYRTVQDQFAEWAYDPAILNFFQEGKNDEGFKPARPFFFESPRNMTREALFGTIHKLEDCMDQIRKNYMTIDGKNLAYEDLFTSQFFQSEFLPLMHDLAYLPIDAISEETNVVMALFINIYNAMNLHCIYDKFRSKIWPELGFTERVKFYNNYRYVIAGQLYSPNDVEHGILRGNNSLGLSSFELAMFKVFHNDPKGSRFRNMDNRSKFVVSRVDPRIHFALWNCTRSCGALRSYTAKNMDSQLELAAREFCMKEVFFEEYSKGNKMKVTMNQIFYWYQHDFGDNKLDGVKYALQFFPPETQNLLQLYLDQRRHNIKIKYSEYDWELNRLDPMNKQEVFVQMN